MTVLLIVLFTLSLLSVTMFMVNTSYLETERDLAAADLRRVMGAVSYESEALSKSATDYARWDDTWLYLNRITSYNVCYTKLLRYRRSPGWTRSSGSASST